MGYAATRSLERVAAAIGELKAAPIQFEAAADIPGGGVVLALPALLAVGLLRHTPAFYNLPKGYYGIESIFLLLAMMALARLTAIEQLRYIAPGEWGNLLGLDRVPEVRCLRNKLELLCRRDGQADKWNTELAKDWMGKCGSITASKPNCRCIMWRGNDCACARPLTTGSTPWTASHSFTSTRKPIRDC